MPSNSRRFSCLAVASVVMLLPLVVYCGIRLIEWNRVRQAKAAIGGAGGLVLDQVVMTGPGFGTARVFHVDLSETELTDAQLAALVPHLSRLGPIRLLSLRGT